MSTETTSPTPQVSTASSWKQSSGAGAPLSVPSGNVCLVRPVDMQTLIRRNMIPNDLMGIITGAMNKNKPPTQKDLETDLDEDRLLSVLQAMDDVVRFVVIEPKIHSVPTKIVDDEEVPDDDARDANLLYIDEVDYEDKTFIFQYAVGGTRDLEKFRTGLAGFMGNVAEEPGVSRETE